MMDTDEEVTNGRVTLLNGNGPPYFHGYLYMKGELKVILASSLFQFLTLKKKTFSFAVGVSSCLFLPEVKPSLAFYFTCNVFSLVSFYPLLLQLV